MRGGSAYSLLAGESLATSLLHQERHGEHFIQDPELALGALLVTRVHEDTTVQQGSVNVRYHTATKVHPQ